MTNPNQGPMPDFNREYGRGDSTPYIDGPPRVGDNVRQTCPNCGCHFLFQVEVTVRDYPLLSSPIGKGMYLGCAACPFASPMMVVAIKEE